MRFAISAAAARVNVRQRMAVGRAFASSRRSTRSRKTVVLPEPAEALTQAQTEGSAAWRCSRVARSAAPGDAGFRAMISAIIARFLVGLVDRPFADPCQMLIVVVFRRIIGARHRRIRRAVPAEGAQQP